jgi:hypothetical protein
MLKKVTLTDSQMEEIQEYCDSIRDRVDTASFDEKRQLIELLDVRGKLAIENGEKVVYVTCLLEPQPVSLALTSHSLCRQQQYSVELTARFVFDANWSLADLLFFQTVSV